MEQLTMSKEAATSLHQNRTQWEVTSHGLKLAAVGISLIAVGFVSASLLGPALAQYVPGWLSIAIIIIGGILCIVGLVTGLIGLSECLVAPLPTSRIILLTGIVLGAFGVSGPIRTLSRFMSPGTRGSERFTDGLQKQMVELMTAESLGSLAYSVTSNVLITVFVLSLASYFSNEKLIALIRRLWVVQFGGVLAVFALTFGLTFLLAYLDLELVGALVSAVLAATQVGATFWLQAKVLRAASDQIRDAADDIAQRVKRANAQKKAAAT